MLLASATNDDILGKFIPKQYPFKLLVIADYDLAAKEPALYEMLKKRYSLIHEKQKEYVFKL
jgi:hypothetical protein